MVDLTTYDPFDPAQQGTHHHVMAELRETCPVARLASGMTVVTRFEDVRAALNDKRMCNSHSARAPGVFVPPDDRLFFFEYDPPEHTALRRLLVDLLSRQHAAEEIPFIRSLSASLLGDLLATGGGDMVSRFSVPLSVMPLAMPYPARRKPSLPTGASEPLVSPGSADREGFEAPKSHAASASVIVRAASANVAADPAVREGVCGNAASGAT